MTSVQVESTRIEVHGERILFVMHCRVVSGEMSAGSLLKLAYGDGIDMAIPADYVVVGEEGVTMVSVACDDMSDAEFLDGLNLVGESLAAD